MIESDFSLSLKEKFPKVYDYQLGTQDGFIDAAELSDSSVPNEEKSGIRLRLRIAPKLDGFPYFVGYTLGHELFQLHLLAGSGGAK